MKHWIYALPVVLLAALEIAGVGYIALWRETFWQYVTDRNLDGFMLYIGIFTGVAIGLSVVVGLVNYLIQMWALEWRSKLTLDNIKRDLSKYENYAQRLQEDSLKYPLLTLNLSKSIGSSLIYVAFYTYLIVSQVGVVYLLIPFLYCALVSGIGFFVAKPLIRLNYMSQMKEATFRFELNVVKYMDAWMVCRNLYKTTKKLTIFQQFVNQIGVIFPYVLLAPLYFSAKITFGVLMQIASAIIHLVDSLNTVVNSFGQINEYLACRKRLKEMEVI